MLRRQGGISAPCVPLVGLTAQVGAVSASRQPLALQGSRRLAVGSLSAGVGAFGGGQGLSVAAFRVLAVFGDPAFVVLNFFVCQLAFYKIL
ncbi:MAG: hypothetical protein J6R89_06795 [Clostridia bacterium]|nr:hypothetical protein [Clostridia bacterium]